MSSFTPTTPTIDPRLRRMLDLMDADPWLTGVAGYLRMGLVTASGMLGDDQVETVDQMLSAAVRAWEASK